MTCTTTAPPCLSCSSNRSCGKSSIAGGVQFIPKNVSRPFKTKYTYNTARLFKSQFQNSYNYSFVVDLSEIFSREFKLIHKIVLCTGHSFFSNREKFYTTSECNRRVLQGALTYDGRALIYFIDIVSVINGNLT